MHHSFEYVYTLINYDNNQKVEGFNIINTIFLRGLGEGGGGIICRREKLTSMGWINFTCGGSRLFFRRFVLQIKLQNYFLVDFSIWVIIYKTYPFQPW